jgi:hypothetical protein
MPTSKDITIRKFQTDHHKDQLKSSVITDVHEKNSSVLSSLAMSSISDILAANDEAVS